VLTEMAQNHLLATKASYPQNSFSPADKTEELDFEWIVLGTEPYCKRILAASPDWKDVLKLEECIFCAAPSAGPIVGFIAVVPCAKTWKLISSWVYSVISVLFLVMVGEV